MKASLRLLSFIALVPTLSFAQLVDFGAHSKPAEPTGFTLLDVAPNTPAATLGLQPGDVVTQLDGRKLIPTTSLAVLVASLYKKGDELSIDWTRNGEQLTGKVILDREISISAFKTRYQASSPQSAKLTAQSLIDELEKEHPNAQAMANVMKLAIESNGTGVIMQATTMNSDGDSVSVTSTGGEERDVKITDKAGELVYEGTITKANLDEVPEKYRATVRNMLGVSPNILISPSVSLDVPPQEESPEEDINDLLKNLESQQGE